MEYVTDGRLSYRADTELHDYTVHNNVEKVLTRFLSLNAGNGVVIKPKLLNPFLKIMETMKIPVFVILKFDPVRGTVYEVMKTSHPVDKLGPEDKANYIP